MRYYGAIRSTLLCTIVTADIDTDAPDPYPIQQNSIFTLE